MYFRTSCFARLYSALAVALLLCGAAFAQGTGTITGVITDPNGSFVVGAQIRVAGTTLTASTDRSGRYTVTGVPPGVQRVSASYLGLATGEASVEVNTGRSASLDLALGGDTIVMQKIEVISEREGQARAINLQRSADQIKNIISADSMGRLPDASAGEALARIPAISIQSDRGEAEFISVRGLSPKYNNVAINGDRAASATDPTESRQSRTVSLDAVPADMISGIEVTKTATPDMDADSLGANVNLITKSPLDFKRRVLNGKIEYGENVIDSRIRPTYSGGFTYGDRYKDGQFGLLVSGSYLDNHRDVNGQEQSYSTITPLGGTPVLEVPTNVRFTYRWLNRTRKAISAQGYVRTGANSSHYIRALYNDFADADTTWTHRARFDSGAVYLAGSNSTSGTIDGGRITRDDRKSVKSTLVWNLVAGGDWQLPKIKLDYSLTFGRSGYEVNRIQPTWEYRLSDYRNAAGVALNADRVADFIYARDSKFTYLTDPLSAFNEFGRAEIGTRGSILKRTDENHEWATTGVVNVTIPANFFGNPGTWKFGVKARNIERYSNPNQSTYNVPAAQKLFLADFLDTAHNTPLWQGHFNIGPSTDVPKFWNFFDANPTRFTFSQAAWDNTNLPTRYVVDETVPAIYGMATTNIGQLRLTGGVRYERTQSDSESYTLNFGPTGTYLGATRINSSRNYDDFFPSLVGTYRFTDRMMLRAGITRSTARPDYNQILGGRVIQDDVDRITEGNPTLQPLKSTNADLSFEWYFTSAGMFSAGLFHKDIKNFIYSTVSTLTEAPYTNWQLTRPENGPHSTLTGFELSYSQNFKSLPAPFNGLGFSGNYTRLDGKSDLPSTRGSVDRLVEQPKDTYNLQLSYEKFPFSVRVACTYNGSYIRSFNVTNAALDALVGELKTYDASLNYTIRPGWVFYLQGKNLGNSMSKYVYQGEGRRDLPIELEFVGWTITSGLKLEF